MKNTIFGYCNQQKYSKYLETQIIFCRNNISTVNASFYICSQQKYCSQAKKLGNAPFTFCSTYSLYASAKMFLLHYSYHKLKSYHNLLFRLNHKSFPDKDSIYEVCILTCRSNKHHRNVFNKPDD